ncbi:unnamed protein product [Ilex paraguariensis]|uniref:O-fucosyltransferase family protein n=1 Tax=Ilex paraguariensis TaxID=185542 RepID=A0ABC8RBL6_9AQUA
MVFAKYAFPWWREKEIVSEERRAQGLCPLTPEEAALVLQAFGFDNGTQIYIASGEIYGGERRLTVLRAAFPRIVSGFSVLHFNLHSFDFMNMKFLWSSSAEMVVNHT